MNNSTNLNAPLAEMPSITNFAYLLVTSVGFGSNYLPVKQYETGDGLFFQFILCLGIWLVGFCVNCIRAFPQFYPLPMLGGALWATGNICVVPIIKTIGIGLGMLFWGTTSLLIGWANARFGWFGVKPEVPNQPFLNFCGVALAVCAGFIYLFVKSTPTNSTPIVISEQEPLLGNTVNGDNPVIVVEDNRDFIEGLNATTKKIIGILLSIGSGVLYGVVFTPVLYIQDNYDHASKNSLDYVFSLYTGILVMSIIFLVIYSLCKNNKPLLYPQIILPGMLSGIMWGIANVSYFMAANELSQAITFPIASSGPAIVGMLWGLVYGEIKGVRNFVILFCGISIAIVGAVMNGISK